MNTEQVLAEFKKSARCSKDISSSGAGCIPTPSCRRRWSSRTPSAPRNCARRFADKVREEVKTKFTAIVSPAVGGIVPGYEMGQQLGVPAMYVERADGKFQLRRNFHPEKNQPVLIVEDIISTGVSSRECLEAIRATGAKPVAAACLIDRSGGKAKVGVKPVALASMKVPAWEADKLPPHLRDIPAVKPGMLAQRLAGNDRFDEMEWSDDAIVLSVRPLGESGAIVEALTRA